jgi:hypothetical protein
MRSDRGASRGWRPPEAFMARLHAVVRELGATRLVVLLAGFQALLSRYCGHLDVSVGSPGWTQSPGMRPIRRDLTQYPPPRAAAALFPGSASSLGARPGNLRALFLAPLQEAQAGRLDEDAGVAEIAPPDAPALVQLIGRRWLRGQKPGEGVGLDIVQPENLADVAEGLRASPHLKSACRWRGCGRAAAGRHRRLGEPRRAEDQRTVVPVRQGQHQALGRRLVVWLR